MRCELCSSGQREHGRRLCLPCMEAVARLWKLANCATVSYAGQDDNMQAAVRTKSASIIVATPNFSGPMGML
jgi:hypothetical protein